MSTGTGGPAELNQVYDECAFTAALENAWRLSASGTRWKTSVQARQVQKSRRKQRLAELRAKQQRHQQRHGMPGTSTSDMVKIKNSSSSKAELEQTFIPLMPSALSGTGSQGLLVIGLRAVLRKLEEDAGKKSELAAVVVCAKPEAVDEAFPKQVSAACKARGVRMYSLQETSPQLLGKALKLRSAMVIGFPSPEFLMPEMRRALATLSG
mmetsp:Transcript_16321/g.31671  ORF Transcript_16321/g.31671 Transcript_16321/m.31671 type:complete len:210 (-) Transcript_16321:1035-1664(-)|eukprot:CAMPEP_0171513760 /NCGR_PEP_ID=MMETSP0959-20130129/2435_1 /TAXON_ID=87120 /ORGANISM="Aurantiochytrium limacinum, Strain ATCCMYA-1381" /LENGTH=209 /DNA_ID=CAMNT_0012051945 /DNA_START=114 /DNA_END=743 /DNA_ORIENTATION=-